MISAHHLYLLGWSFWKQLKCQNNRYCGGFDIIIFKNLQMNKPAHKSDYDIPEWHFDFCEGSLSPTAEIQETAEECKLFRPPTILFGSNYCNISHKGKTFKLMYNAREALRFINFEHRKQNYYGPEEDPKPNGISYLPPKLQIKHAEKWKQIGIPKDIQISEVEESSDSFFITSFKGKLEGEFKVERTKDNVIPVHKLGQNNQMVFYKQGSLYEDELDDNGLIQYEYKFRSMQDGNWFALIRCYVRVDEVHVLILDTRLYWEPGWKKVGRQFMVKEGKWQELKAKGFDTMNGWTTNPHQSHIVYEFLDEKFVENEYIIIGN